MKYQEDWGKIKECKFCKMLQQKSIFQNNESSETFYSAPFLEPKKKQTFVKLHSKCLDGSTQFEAFHLELHQSTMLQALESET